VLDCASHKSRAKGALPSQQRRLPRRLGPPASVLAQLPFPALSASSAGFRGEVILVDRFGNLVTSIGQLISGEGFLSMDPWIPGVPASRLAGPPFVARLEDGTQVPVARTFADVPRGAPLAYVGSDGLLEIGVNGGSAASVLGLDRGAAISLVSSSAGR